MLRPNLDGYHDPSRDLWRHVETRTARAIRRGQTRFDEALRSPTDLEKFQAHVRDVVLQGIGGELPAGADDSPGRLRRRREIAPANADYRIEKGELTTAIGTVVPLTTYVPDAVGPHPAVLFLAGHDPAGKASAAYQRACALFAQVGFLVASFDPLGQGERHGYADAHPPIAPGTTEHTYAGIPYWWSGASLARYFLNDSDAVLSYLRSRADVNPESIIATGSSGGGMLTTLLMALEPRLAGAAPATYVTSRLEYFTPGARQDAEQILLGATEAGLDHDWLLAAMAPKPVCVLATNWDFFPIEGTLRTCQRAALAWELLDKPEDFQLVRVDTPHTYHREMALAAIDFFAPRFGLEMGSELAEFEPQIFGCGELAITPDGQVSRAYENAIFGSEFLQRDAVRRQAVPASSRSGPTTNDEAEARKWLRARVFAHREPVEPNVRYIAGEQEWHALWRNEEHIWGAGVLGNAPGELVEHIVLGDRGGAGAAPAGALALEVRGRGALRLHDRDGLAPENQASSTYRIISDLLWLGDSLAAAQVWDIMRAIDIFAGPEVRLIGTGYGAYLARLAAFCDERVTALSIGDEYVDPNAFLNQREYDRGRGAWHGIIPGLLHHAPWRTIVAATEPLIQGA